MPLREVHIHANWRIQSNNPCTAVMQHYVKLLWPLVIIINTQTFKQPQLTKKPSRNIHVHRLGQNRGDMEIQREIYRDCPSAGEPARWLITCIWFSSGANMLTSAFPRLKCTKHLCYTMHNSCFSLSRICTHSQSLYSTIQHSTKSTKFNKNAPIWGCTNHFS